MLASDPTFPLFPTLAFLGFILCAIPLSWHLQAWNSGTCAFMIWTGLACLITGINSIIWVDNALNVAPIWCDISSQIILGASLGIPASTLCISRRLYRITSTQTVSITRSDKIRAIYTDILIALGIPILFLILHIIVQGHRFDILEEYGCTSVTYNTLPAYFLYYIWPIAVGLVSLVYSSLILRTFYMRRIHFNQVLSSNGMINPSRYLRLMLLALIDIMCTLPIGTYTIYISLKGLPLAPWISWDDTHFDFGFVQLIPAVIWRSDFRTYTSVQITRWLPIVCAFVFFALFGFAEEAMKNYRRAFWFFVKPFGFHPVSRRRTNGGKGQSALSALKSLKLRSDDKDLPPAYVNPTEPVIPSARKNLRRSFLEADSRSTICFPDDDDVELGPYRKSFTPLNSDDAPSSPSSSTSACGPRTPITPTVAPPLYVDSRHNDAAAFSLSKCENDRSVKAPSFVSLPEMDIPYRTIRPSSYLPEAIQNHDNHEREEDRISISDTYIDSRPTSPAPAFIPQRVPTPMPFTASELPTLPPPALAFHRPFSPPSIYPMTMTTMSQVDRDAGPPNGIAVTVHTQSSRESL
ncbi:pheromone A receptor-domain-containing protein [Lentinula lateritia]|uniref:Pheromone A receptor-domain-containing protein n=1 Tax=Lentinula lateritia TaxID=40482 RepID=A0ABQ8V6M2_9AGAR|nr:pheromone A receptor-domain-containing protein [Lentinula lateritia]